jgi:hypothetical protein
MVSIRVLKSTMLAIKSIEEAIAEADPYNIQFPIDIDDENNGSLLYCDFPDQVEDPLLLVRLMRGVDFARQLEYEDHLEIILYHLTDCLEEELKKRNQNEADIEDCHSSEDEGEFLAKPI